MEQLTKFLCAFTAFVIISPSISWAENADGFNPGVPSSETQELTVLEVTPEFKERLQNLGSTFSLAGTDAVAKEVAADLQNPEKLAAWQNFAQSGEMHVVSVKTHPERASAIEWMNRRFARMGVKNLKLEGAFDSSLEDPAALLEQSPQVKKKKWLRYIAGPGVALAAAVIARPEFTGQPISDYMLLVVPAAGVGLTTILLEYQFAAPALNQFWARVWAAGGPVVGRFTNTFVNFMYGMALYGAGVGSSYLPVLFGGEPIPFKHDAFLDATLAAAWGGFLFHLAMGQYQIDISNEVKRGALGGYERYSRETTGVLVNNSARVLDWVLPMGIGAYAQGLFFFWKTLPQLYSSNVATTFSDRAVRRELLGEAAAPKNILERCRDFLSRR